MLPGEVPTSDAAAGPATGLRSGENQSTAQAPARRLPRRPRRPRDRRSCARFPTAIRFPAAPGHSAPHTRRRPRTAIATAGWSAVRSPPSTVTPKPRITMSATENSIIAASARPATQDSARLTNPLSPSSHCMAGPGLRPSPADRGLASPAVFSMRVTTSSRTGRAARANAPGSAPPAGPWRSFP